MKIPFLFLSAISLLHINCKIVIVDQENQDAYYDRTAAFGPRVAEDGIEGYLVSVETLKTVNNIIPNTLHKRDIIFAQPTPSDGVMGTILPQHGCTLRERPAWLKENEPWIALVERGGCGFIDKVRMMQKSGAIAVVVGNNEMSSGLITMFAPGDTEDVVIPSTFIMQWAYRDLRFLIRSAIMDQQQQGKGSHVNDS